MPREAKEKNTNVIVFPFDLFGGNGCGQGAELLGDAVREILEDNYYETWVTRSAVYQKHVKLREISFGTIKSLSSWRTVGRQVFRQSLKQGERVLWLGGNHLSVLPVYEELGVENAASTLVVQFDAHLDVQRMHDVNPNPAPGNFLLHSEETLPSVMNLGHRDLFLPKKEIDTYFTATYSSLQLSLNLEQIVSDVRARAKKARRVWIDIDADVFDPVTMPGVHAPIAFGPDPLTILKLIDAAFAGHVIGVSISEYNPGRDVRDSGLNLFGWLIEWLLLRWYEPREEED